MPKSTNRSQSQRTQNDGPLCFVLMPFGIKKDESGKEINFNAIYSEMISPAVKQAGLTPMRADQETIGGIIHKPMFERLVLCSYAVADLTTANANVLYELGVRHAVLPKTTVILHAEGSRLPFDVAPIRSLPYAIDADGTPEMPEKSAANLAGLLKAVKEAQPTDSPVFQLLKGYPDLRKLDADAFRDRANESQSRIGLIENAWHSGLKAVSALEKKFGLVADLEFDVALKFLQAYRDLEGWKELITLVDKMSPSLAKASYIREQYALALNRNGQGAKAEKMLTELISERGSSSETLGILGRIYKDRWAKERGSGSTVAARGYLEKAIDTYLQGFECDSRDYYPGVNALTLMVISNPRDPRIAELQPVVKYAAERSSRKDKPGYWTQATLLELAAIARDAGQARFALQNALALEPNLFERKSTAGNLQILREAMATADEPLQWLRDIELELLRIANLKIAGGRKSR